MTRRERDFYETDPKLVRPLLARIAKHTPGYSPKRILEPCVGDGSLLGALKEQWPQSSYTTNDIDSARRANSHRDAADPTQWPVPWVTRWHLTITNPPFSQAQAIIDNARRHSDVVIALVRLSFLEPTKSRGAWLQQWPPSSILVTPRWSFTANGKSDSVTTAWCVWHSVGEPLLRPFDVITREEIR